MKTFKGQTKHSHKSQDMDINVRDISHESDDFFPKLSLEFLKIKDNILQKEEKLDIFKNLKDVLQHTWRDISQLGKHGIGFELIPCSNLKCAYPKANIFSKTEKATVFHKNGKEAALVGFRIDDTYYLFCVDRDYKAYNH